MSSFVHELNEIMPDFHKCPAANNTDSHNKKRGSIDKGDSHKPWFDGTCMNLYKTYRKSLTILISVNQQKIIVFYKGVKRNTKTLKGPITIRRTPLPTFLVNFSTFAFL